MLICIWLLCKAARANPCECPSGVPQRVKHYSLNTVAAGTSPNLCTGYSLSSAPKRMLLHGIRRQVCIQMCWCLNLGALPCPSGTSAEAIKAAVFANGENRERKAESSRKSVIGFVCVQESQGTGWRGRSFSPLHRRGWSIKEGINPHRCVPPRSKLESEWATG